MGRRIALPADIMFLRIIGNWCQRNAEMGERFLTDEVFREDILAHLERLLLEGKQRIEHQPEPIPDIMAALKRSLAEKRVKRDLLAAVIDETVDRNGR
jgi:hypothetical protein